MTPSIAMVSVRPSRGLRGVGPLGDRSSVSAPPPPPASGSASRWRVLPGFLPTEDRLVEQAESVDHDLDAAVGRLVGSGGPFSVAQMRW